MVAIVVSILEVIRRRYKPRDFLVSVTRLARPPTNPPHRAIGAHPASWCSAVTPSSSTRNANRFVDDVGALVDDAPNPVRWVVLDASSLDDIDYSASVSVAGLLDYLDAKAMTFALARADTGPLYTWQPAG